MPPLYVLRAKRVCRSAYGLVVPDLVSDLARPGPFRSNEETRNWISTGALQAPVASRSAYQVRDAQAHDKHVVGVRS